MLVNANEILKHEPQSTIAWGGVWANAIARLAPDNHGATAVYKILQEKLATGNAVAPAAAAAPAPPPPQHSVRRSRARDNDSSSQNNVESPPQALEPPTPKRLRQS